MNSIIIVLGAAFLACVLTDLALHSYTRLHTTRRPQPARTQARLLVIHHHLKNLGACTLAAGATTVCIHWAISDGPLILAVIPAALLGAVTLTAIVGYLRQPQPERVSTT